MVHIAPENSDVQQPEASEYRELLHQDIATRDEIQTLVSTQLTQVKEPHLPAIYGITPFSEEEEAKRASCYPIEDARQNARYYDAVRIEGRNVLSSELPDWCTSDLDPKCTFEPWSSAEDGSYYTGDWYDPCDDEGIIFTNKTPPTPGREGDDLVLPWREGHPLVPRRIRDVVTYCHEYGHAFFDKHLKEAERRKIKIALWDKYKGKQPSALDMAERSLNEGMALYFEHRACQAMLVHSEHFSLTENDVADVQKMISTREKALSENIERAQSTDAETAAAGKRACCYNEGLHIVTKLFESYGQKGALDILKTLDPVRLSLVERSDPDYQAAMKDPRALEKFKRQ